PSERQARGAERGCHPSGARAQRSEAAQPVLTPARSDRHSSAQGGGPAIAVVTAASWLGSADGLVSLLGYRDGEFPLSSRNGSDVFTQLQPTKLTPDECSGGQSSPIGAAQLPRPFQQLARHLFGYRLAVGDLFRQH